MNNLFQCADRTAARASVLIMAGGQSRRMRQAVDQTHKALMPILGLPMIERNLCWLLALGFSDLYVAVAAIETALISHILQRCQPLAAAFGAHLAILIEPSPLGTLGACRLCSGVGDLLVVNVDNLTSIDLLAMLELHRRRSAAMTIATHVETFCMPFGQLVLEHDSVLQLREKPESAYQISSGTYVLAPRAREAIAANCRTGPLELFGDLRRNGQATLAYRHAALWIDVNDADTLARARSLVASHHAELDCPWPEPASERVLLCSADKSALLISRPRLLPHPPAVPRPRWPQATFIASFDEAQLDGKVTRCHLFQRRPAAGASRPGFRPLREDAALQTSRIEVRCLAYQDQASRQVAS